MNRLLACTSIIALCTAFAITTAYADGELQPASNSSMSSTLESQIQRAKELREKGDFAEASKSLRQLMLVAGTDPRVVSEYGKVLAQQGYAKDAVSVLSKATQLNGTDWTLYSALGVAYDQMDDRANARKSYDRALAMKPGEPSVLNNYAVSRMLSGDYDGAVQMLAPLRSNDPKIVANLSKAEELKAAHATRSATAQAPVNKTAIAAIVPAKADSSVVMQKVPVDAKAGPVRAANGAPHALVAKATAKPVVAAAALKLDTTPNNIVMQKVPADPQAGPVKVGAIKPAQAGRPVEIAKAAPKPTAKTPAPPSLRTAAD